MSLAYRRRLSILDTRHNCADHVHIEFLDWDRDVCGYTYETYQVTCVCGFQGVWTITSGRGLDEIEPGPLCIVCGGPEPPVRIPTDATFYTDPGWETTP